VLNGSILSCQRFLTFILSGNSHSKYAHPSMLWKVGIK